MLFLLLAEADKLCLKDLSSDLTEELDQRLTADKAAMEKLYQFFGLKLGHQFRLADLKDLFPDTTVSVLKKCFEALRMYDFAEIMEKVRPRSLRPALSPDQIEKLWRAGDRPTKYHSDVAVLVVTHSVEDDIVERNEAEKIEIFIKDLNSRSEVATISLASSQETRELLRKIDHRDHRKYIMRYYHLDEERLKTQLESILQEKALFEKELEMQMGKGFDGKTITMKLSVLKVHELQITGDLEDIAKAKKQEERNFEKLKELEKESTKLISTAMDKWIHNQGWLT